MFFFKASISRLPKIHRSALRKKTIDDVYAVNVSEKLAITVKRCFIESRVMIYEAAF